MWLLLLVSWVAVVVVVVSCGGCLGSGWLVLSFGQILFPSQFGKKNVRGGGC